MVRGGGGIDIVTGGSGADTFVFDKKVAGSHMIVQNMGTGADKIGLDTDNSSTLTTNAYDTTGTLTNGGNITSVADHTTLAVDDACRRAARAASSTSRIPASCTSVRTATSLAAAR